MRLTRTGRRNRPYYRIVVMDSRKRRDGRYIEKIGTYDPIKEGDNVILSEDRVQYWLSEGVQLSDTVRSMLSKKGILLKNHLKKANLDEELKSQEMQKWEALKIQKQKETAQEVKLEEKTEEKKEDEESAGSVEQKATENVEIKSEEQVVEKKIDESEKKDDVKEEVSEDKEMSEKKEKTDDNESKEDETGTETSK